MSPFNVLLALHIAGGSVALLSGPVPMLSRKGGLLHRRAGDVYAAAMALTGVCGFALARISGNGLLLVIAVLTIFLVFSGVRAIHFLRGARPSLADHAVCILTFTFSAWLPWRGVFSHDVTRLFFGFGGGFLAARQLWLLLDPSSDWLASHLSLMCAAYIATVTAFLVVNLTFLPAPVVFIAPTLIGTPLITFASVRLRLAVTRGG